MVGEWKMISSENFEEVMKKLGVGYLTRKIGSTTKPNVRLEKNGDELTMTTISALKTHAIKFKIGEEFDEETIDGRKVRTTFTVDGNKLVQNQKDSSGSVVCVITREITSNGQLKTVSTHRLSYIFDSTFINLMMSFVARHCWRCRGHSNLRKGKLDHALTRLLFFLVFFGLVFSSVLNKTRLIFFCFFLHS